MTEGIQFVRLDEQPIQPHFHTNDGLLMVWTSLKKGTFVPQHSHAYGHTSMLAQGSVRVIADGKELGVFSAPEAVWIRPRTKHLFEALEDNTIVLCVHREETFEIVSEHHIVPEKES